MQIISELEGYRRGLYAGGSATRIPGGRARHLHRDSDDVLHDGVALLQAGGGIVADSDPTAEHEECLRKLAALEARDRRSRRRRAVMLLLIDNYDSFTYNLAHLFGELGVGGGGAAKRRDHASTRPSGSRRRTS